MNALLSKDASAREKAIRYLIKHLNDDSDPEMEEMSDMIKSTVQVIKLAITDKVFKVINKGLDLLEELTISCLLECDLGFQVFTHALVESDILFLLCCRAEDNQKKIREKTIDALLGLC